MINSCYVSDFRINTVGKVLENSPAYECGIKPGDKIISINGSSVHITAEASFAVFINGTAENEITVKRNGEKLKFNVSPAMYIENYKDENGKTLMYASPSNLSPASNEYKELVAERVEMLRTANPDMDETAIPVDLVTCSGSGLDPHISPAAAEYQVARIAKANDMTEDDVRRIIEECTDGRFLGLFGEETVNVLEVNLMLDGILK